MPGSFFGDLGPFQIVVSVVAFLTGAHTLCTVLARAKIKVFLADSVGLVVSPYQITAKFHLGCNLVNPSAKVGALHRLETIVVDPHRRERIFQWNLFFEYAPGSAEVRKTTDPFPIAVSPRSSALQFIEFKLANDAQIDFWPQGRYEFRMLGWANRPGRNTSPNLRTIFHIEVDDMLSLLLAGSESNGDRVVRVPILEWCASGK